MKKIVLVAVDYQNSFCDPQKGELFVQGADKDAVRVAGMIDRLRDKLTAIHCTLDSHQPIHVAHPVFWMDEKGNHPTPFTQITYSDLKSGRWKASFVGLSSSALHYVEQLEKNGRYPLCIWPPHCLIGSYGAALYQPFFDAVRNWSEKRFGIIDFVTKGSNILTEHYSAIKADVPDPKDPGTQINAAFVNAVNESDLVLFTGEASSHCVRNTAIDMCDYFPDITKKIVLLTDSMSPVPGFEKMATDFFAEMVSRGATLSTTVDILR